MENIKKIEWILRISVFGTFLGHGVFALQGKEKWVQWIVNFFSCDAGLATQLLLAIGILDITVALIVLLKPIRAVLLWAVIWTSWTTVMHILPFIGDPIWESVERLAHIGAPLSLLLLLGWPKNLKEWFNR